MTLMLGLGTRQLTRSVGIILGILGGYDAQSPAQET